MAHPFRITGIIALAATAACSTEPTGPTSEARAFSRSAAATASGTVVVTERDITRQQEDTPPLDNWVYYSRLPTSTGVFRQGPGNPPLGSGSFEMSTPLDADKGTLFNYDHRGTRLADISDISYATYRTSPTAGVVLPSINIQVDRDGGAFLLVDFMTLVYEPYIDGGVPQNGDWQTWETIPGRWWATRPITLADGTVCLPHVCTFTWNQLVAALPNATIVGGFGVNQGSFNGGLIAATDALSITHNGSTWTYDFELFRSPKDECKDGGWETMTRADGSPFKNQGQCVKYHQENSGGSDET